MVCYPLFSQPHNSLADIFDILARTSHDDVPGLREAKGWL